MTLYPVLSNVVAAVYLDVDGTLFVQMGFFLATLFILHFLLIRPYLRTLDLRSEAVEGSTEEAGEMSAQSEILSSKYDEKVLKARRDAHEVRESLRTQGLAEQDDILGEVRAELAQTLEEQRSQIAAHVEDARSELEARADQLAESMIQRLLPQS
jgi:F-type H+-transporting ATPase subunit b